MEASAVVLVNRVAPAQSLVKVKGENPNMCRGKNNEAIEVSAFYFTRTTKTKRNLIESVKVMIILN